jgi:hypothetical protein
MNMVVSTYCQSRMCSLVSECDTGASMGQDCNIVRQA